MMMTAVLTRGSRMPHLSQKGTSLLLNSPSMSFARYFNRA